MVCEDFLQFDDYVFDENIYDEKLFFDLQGGEKFNATSSKQMLLMMNKVGATLSLDTYAMKKLEVVIRTELPTFAINRNLVFKWLKENFLF